MNGLACHGRPAEKFWGIKDGLQVVRPGTPFYCPGSRAIGALRRARGAFDRSLGALRASAATATECARIYDVGYYLEDLIEDVEDGWPGMAAEWYNRAAENVFEVLDEAKEENEDEAVPEEGAWPEIEELATTLANHARACRRLEAVEHAAYLILSRQNNASHDPKAEAGRSCDAERRG